MRKKTQYISTKKKIKKLENKIFQNNLTNEIEKKLKKKIRLVKNKIEKKKTTLFQ